MADTLAKAKGALMGAESFDKSAAKQAGHEYSSAPYSAAHKQRTETPKPKPTSSIADEAASAAAGIRAKQQNVDEYLKATKE